MVSIAVTDWVGLMAWLYFVYLAISMGFNVGKLFLMIIMMSFPMIAHIIILLDYQAFESIAMYYMSLTYVISFALSGLLYIFEIRKRKAKQTE